MVLTFAYEFRLISEGKGATMSKLSVLLGNSPALIAALVCVGVCSVGSSGAVAGQKANENSVPGKSSIVREWALGPGDPRALVQDVATAEEIHVRMTNILDLATGSVADLVEKFASSKSAATDVEKAKALGLALDKVFERSAYGSMSNTDMVLLKTAQRMEIPPELPRLLEEINKQKAQIKQLTEILGQLENAYLKQDVPSVGEITAQYNSVAESVQKQISGDVRRAQVYGGYVTNASAASADGPHGDTSVGGIYNPFSITNPIGMLVGEDLGLF